MNSLKRVQREPAPPGPFALECLCTLLAGQGAKTPVLSTALIMAMLLAGCTSFDASDHGDTKEVLLGKKFTISLPTTKEQRIPQVENPAVARFVGCRPDHPEGTDVYEFATTGLGETKIVIPGATPAPDVKEYVLIVKVVIGGSPHY